MDKQLQDGESDLEINLATLKLMTTIYPELIDVSVIRKVLILSVSAYPANEFSLCMFQIPERLHKTDELRKVVELAHLLEMTKFNQFWREAESANNEAERPILDECKNWRGKIRDFIAEVVTLTYQSIDMSDFAELTNLKGKEADARKLVQSKGLILEGDKVIIQQPEAAADDSQPVQLTADQLKKVLVSVR